MERIGKHLEGYKQRVDFKERYEQAKRELMDDSLVKKIMQEFDLVEESIGPYLAQLENVRTSYANCKACTGLNECSNQMFGHKVYIQKHNGEPVFINKPCELLIRDNEQKRQRNMIKSFFVSDEFREIDFADIEAELGETTRLKIKKFLIQYAKDVVPGEDGFGVYLYGWFGSGKSFMMWALVNYLSKKRGINSIYVYVPEFFRELKNSIGNKGVNMEDKLKEIKEVPVLVLDDIGSEPVTPWVRDEILGPILQHRVNEKLPTLYTSNKSLEDLREYLSYTRDNGKENQKAERIMERIENYCHVLQSPDRNRRKEKNAHRLTRIE